MACLIWDASTVQTRPLTSEVSRCTRTDRGRTPLMSSTDSVRRGAIATGRRSEGLARARLSMERVSPRAIFPTDSMPEIGPASSGGAEARAIAACPRIAVRMLLNSWVTWVASWPTASIFWAWAAIVSSCLSSVTSCRASWIRPGYEGDSQAKTETRRAASLPGRCSSSSGRLAVRQVAPGSRRMASRNSRDSAATSPAKGVFSGRSPRSERATLFRYSMHPCESRTIATGASSRSSRWRRSLALRARRVTSRRLVYERISSSSSAPVART